MYSGEAVETGRGARRVRRGAPSLHAGPLPLDADAGHQQERQSADPDPRPAAAAAPAAERLQFRAALPHFVAGDCDARRRSDAAGRRVIDGHESRCLRLEEIDWTRRPRKADALDADRRSAATVLEVDRLKKHYQVARERRCSAAARRARSRRSRTSRSPPARPRCWRSSANRVAASRHSPRCCSGSRWRARDSSSFDHEAIQNKPVERRADRARSPRSR